MPDVRPVPIQTSTLRLRPVELGDWEALNALHRWAWFPERSAAGWAWLFGMSGPTPGWVLEDDNGVCGFLGNFVQAYAWRGERRQAATGYSLIVLPRARGGSRTLLRAFRRQPDVVATSILNGNRRSAGIYAAEGFSPFPSGWADAKIVWPIRPLTIAAERLAWGLARGRRPARELFAATSARRTADSCDPRLQHLDPSTDAADLDRYWCALGGEGRLLADRSSAALARRFSDPDQTIAPVLVGWREGHALQAVALAQLGKMSEIEAAILDIIDLTWLPEASPAAPIAVVSALKHVARDLQASRLRLPVVNARVATVATQVDGALLRRRHVHAHVVLRRSDETSDWEPTPYDGDYSFALRPPPGLTHAIDPRPQAAQLSRVVHIP